MSEEKFDMNIEDFKIYVKSIANFILAITSFMFKVFRANILLLSVVVTATAFFSFFMFKNKERVYEERMSCIYADSYSKAFGEMLLRIDFLLHSKDYKEAAELLNMDLKKVEKIKSIEGKTMALGKLEENYSTHNEPFYIYAKVTDPKVFPALEQKLIVYLSQNPFSQKNLKRQKQKWNSRIHFYEQQIYKLDSLKDVIRLSYLANNNQINLSQQNNSVVDIYKLSDSMSFFLADMNFYYHNHAPIERLTGFMPFKKNQNQSFIKYLVVFSLFALIAAWFLLAIRMLALKSMKN